MAGSDFLQAGSERLPCEAMKVKLVLLCRSQQDAKADINVVHLQRKVPVSVKAHPKASTCMLLVGRPGSTATKSTGLRFLLQGAFSPDGATGYNIYPAVLSVLYLVFCFKL